MAKTLNSTGFDTGTNYGFGDKLVPANTPRSAFDWSHLIATTIDNAGLVVPLRVYETLPASDYEISVKSLVRVLPQVVPLYSRQRMYVYAFYSRCSDLWAGWQTFIRKGYSGNKEKALVTIDNSFLDFHVDITPTNPEIHGLGCMPCSLGDYLHLPQGVSGFSKLHLNAMPFMMYLKIWRDYFLNKNYLLTKSGDSYDLDTLSECILPDDDSRFRLGDDGNILSFADKGKKFYCDIYGACNYGYDKNNNYAYVPSKGMSWIKDKKGNDTFVLGLFYHDYPDDYFTSALPWSQRGEAPSLSVDFVFKDDGGFKYFQNPNNISNLGRIAFPAVSTGQSSSDSIAQGDLIWATLGVNSSHAPTTMLGGTSGDGATFTKAFTDWLSNSVVNSSSSRITLEALRDLAVKQTIMEKMAHTDGSYAQFGLTFFGEVSKAAVDYSPTYIGGTYTNLVFSEVLQTSSTTENSMLGQYAGHGIGFDNNGYIGKVHSDDWGYIMLCACIMPDVYYSQGLDKLWSRNLQADWYLPERANLGMQPILNKQVYLQPDTVVDTDGNPVNDGLWAWQDIYDEYRFQDNIITGKLADKNNETFYPYTQSRKFTSLPNWGAKFAEASDVRKDYLSAPSENAYSMQYDVNIRAVEPLGYRARPADMLG